MATTAEILYRGVATDNPGTVLYTVPASTKTIITNIIVTNTSSEDKTFSMELGGVDLHKDSKVSANSTAYFNIRQVLESSQTIAANAENTINFHISGVEIS